MKTLVIVLCALFGTRSANANPDEERLTRALLTLPQVQLQPDAAAQIVTIVQQVAVDTNLDPHVLLAQLWTESRFDSTTTSRLVNGRRQTGPWRSRRAPTGWSGTLYCGISQTVAVTWKACLELRDDLALAVRRQAAELARWLQRSRGDLARALGGYGCGNAGLTNGCRGYAQRIQALAKKIRRYDAPLS